VDETKVPARRSDVIEAEVDGERVLMSGRDYSYFGLAGTAVEVWRRIDGSSTIASIIDGLAAEYAADRGLISEEVVEFVSALHAAGLIDA
jgi:hypothetical protein